LRYRGTAIVVGAVLGAGRAHADDARAMPASHGLELGVHVGLAHPGGAVGAGSAATTPNVADIAPTWFPIGLEGGYRFWPTVYVGATLEWGPTTGSGPCGACSEADDLQAHGEVRLYAAPRSTFDPWLSFGFGWEVLHLSLGQGSTGASASYDGPVLLAVALGLDVRSRAFAVGPFFGFSMGEYASHSLSPAPPGEPSVGGHALHEWFTLGVRGTYGPW